jgi:hypothetical protein
MGGLFSATTAQTPEERERQEEAERQQQRQLQQERLNEQRRHQEQERDRLQLSERRRQLEAETRRLQQVEQKRRQLELAEKERRERDRFIDLGTLRLKGHASFCTPNRHRWTSNQAALKFRGEGNRATQEIRVFVIKRWKQASRRDEREEAEPEFREEEMARLVAYASNVFRNKLNGIRQEYQENRESIVQYEEDKEHLVDLCELCKDLGRNCTRREIRN